MNSLLTTFFILSTLTAWNFNQHVLADPKSKSILITQTTPFISEFTKIPQEDNINYTPISSQGISSPNLVAGRRNSNNFPTLCPVQ